MTRHRGRMKNIPGTQNNVTSFQKSKTWLSNKNKFIMAGIFMTLVASIILFYHMPSSSGRTPILSSNWHLHKNKWSAKQLSPDQNAKVCNRWNEERFWACLDPILVARPPGSDNIRDVAVHIASLLHGKFVLESDEFKEKPPHPYPVTRFANIIATHNPAATRKLVLACHYDSKIKPVGFIGATDSAAPCAMMIEIALMLEPYLTELSRNQNASFGRVTHDVTLQLLFLDGEEAFVEWRGNDNTYGARHLAGKWHTTSYTAHKERNVLDGIDLFVLLDLIGASSTQFQNNQATPTRWYSRVAEIEKTLRKEGLIEPRRAYFNRRPVHYPVEDDHIPFQQKDVSILHLISIPFPKVWHKLTDDKSALHTPTMEEITKILAVFVAEYLQLNINN